MDIYSCLCLSPKNKNKKMKNKVQRKTPADDYEWPQFIWENGEKVQKINHKG